MKKKILRCAIYIRVSTWEQAVHGKSLTAQKEYLENYAEQHGMYIMGVYADEGQTARRELKKRKAIHALLADVKAGLIDVILFWRMDRWFRNVADFYKVQDILDAHQVRWIDVGEPNINMETRDGRLSLNLALSIGQNEVDTTSERIKFTVDNTIKNGGVVFGDENLPTGYKIGIIDGRKRVVKNEEEAPIVEEAIRLLRTYHNKRYAMIRIQETLDENFSYMKLKSIINSEFYIGKYRDNLNYCPPYMTPEEQKSLQDLLKTNIKSTPSGRIYLFSGLMRCPLCGQRLVGIGKNSIINRKTGEKRTYCYYRCNRSLIDHICKYAHCMSQNLIEDYLLKNIGLEYEKYLVRCQVSQKAMESKKLKKSPEKIRTELERLNLLFQKGRVSYEYYEKEYTRLEAELSAIEIPEPPKAPADASYLETVLSSNFESIYAALDAKNKQSLWKNTIRQIYLTPESQISHIDFL